MQHHDIFKTKTVTKALSSAAHAAGQSDHPKKQTYVKNRLIKNQLSYKLPAICFTSALFAISHQSYLEVYWDIDIVTQALQCPWLTLVKQMVLSTGFEPVLPT